MGVKARKQTSKRKTLKQKFKTIRKVADFKRKIKKLSKKDPAALHRLIRPKTKKDKTEGVPSLFPDRAKVLLEASQVQEEVTQAKAQTRAGRKRRAEQRKKDLAISNDSKAAIAIIEKNIFHQGVSTTLTSSKNNFKFNNKNSLDNEGPLEMELGFGSLLNEDRKTKFWSDIHQVVISSHLILFLFDVRDIASSRCTAVESLIYRVSRKEGSVKPMIIVINKIDLVPISVTRSAIAYCQQICPQCPVVAVTCAEDQDFDHITGLPLTEIGCSGISAIQSLVSSYSSSSNSNTSKETHTVVGVLGYANVGKSSLINTLLKSRSASVGMNPFFTKSISRHRLGKGVYLVDSPAIPPTLASPGPISCLPLNAPLETLHALFSTFPPTMIQQALNIPDFLSKNGNILPNSNDNDEDQLDENSKEEAEDPYAFSSEDFLNLLQVYASHGGARLAKGGHVDPVSASRQFLRDWNNSYIPFYSSLPTKEDKDRDKQYSKKEEDLPAEWSESLNGDEMDQVETDPSLNESVLHRLMTTANKATLIELAKIGAVKLALAVPDGELKKSNRRIYFMNKPLDNFFVCQHRLSRALFNQLTDELDQEEEEDEEDFDDEEDEDEEEELGDDENDIEEEAPPPKKVKKSNNSLKTLEPTPSPSPPQPKSLLSTSKSSKTQNQSKSFESSSNLKVNSSPSLSPTGKVEEKVKAKVNNNKKQQESTSSMPLSDNTKSTRSKLDSNKLDKADTLNKSIIDEDVDSSVTPSSNSKKKTSNKKMTSKASDAPLEEPTPSPVSSSINISKSKVALATTSRTTRSKTKPTAK